MSAAKVTAKLRQVGHVAMLDGGRTPLRLHSCKLRYIDGESVWACPLSRA
jgi:hypothetical protein